VPARPMKSDDDTENSTSDTTPSGDTITRAELEEILAARDRKHAEEIAAYRARVPVAMVPANAGGPGFDNHQASWSLAEQEAAQRGEILDHWIIRNP
jgi:hypothetical protein